MRVMGFLAVATASSPSLPSTLMRTCWSSSGPPADWICSAGNKSGNGNFMRWLACLSPASIPPPSKLPLHTPLSLYHITQ